LVGLVRIDEIIHTFHMVKRCIKSYLTE
jgi:hypothetical protein